MARAGCTGPSPTSLSQAAQADLLVSRLPGEGPVGSLRDHHRFADQAPPDIRGAVCPRPAREQPRRRATGAMPSALPLRGAGGRGWLRCERVQNGHRRDSLSIQWNGWIASGDENPTMLCAPKLISGVMSERGLTTLDPNHACLGLH